MNTSSISKLIHMLEKDLEQSTKWNITDGYHYPEFRDYVNSKNNVIIRFLISYNLKDANGERIDFLHMLTTLAAERSDSTDPNLAGWAGDLQSFIKDLKIFTYGKDLDNISLSDKAYDIIVHPKDYYEADNSELKSQKFPRSDFLADIDAKNIGYRYNESCYLSYMISNYYTIYFKSRFSDFITNLGGYKKMQSLVTDYTRGDDVIQHLILHKCANEAAERESLKKAYSESYDGNYIELPINPYIHSLPHPSIVTFEESNALKYVFERLITEGLYEEENQYS